MRANPSHVGHLLLAAVALAPLGRADIENNDTKAQAEWLSIFPGVAPTLGFTSNTDPDYYRCSAVDLGQLDLSMLVENTGSNALTADLLGLQQTGGVVTANEVVLVGVTLAPGQSHSFRWYSLLQVPQGPNYGQLFLRLRGTAAATTNYRLTPNSAPIPVPQAVPGFFAPGTITISTLGQTATDTDLWIHDHDFVALSGAGSDDLAPSNPASRVVRAFTNGRYYIAISDRNLASSALAPAGDGQQNADVTDYSSVLVATSGVASASLNFTIDDGSGPVSVTETKPGAHGVAFVSFQVGPPTTIGSVGPFCAGDGLDPNVTTACPCNNFGAPGRGCANSLNTGGALLDDSGPSSAFHTSGMPFTATHIYFQGDDYYDGVFGDGLRCTGGNLIRLRIKMSVAGESFYPEGTDPSIQVRGMVGPGSGRRYYQVYYRNAAASFCPPATFNASNGWILDW
ncbi:MAG: hypothetical protein HZA53_11170 [Planctomycetes bacterium]|nr:hypothetical protein [Planctomycetota bacterium]